MSQTIGHGWALEVVQHTHCVTSDLPARRLCVGQTLLRIKPESSLRDLSTEAYIALRQCRETLYFIKLNINS